MGFWECVMWMFIAYCVYKVMTAGSITDMEKFKRGIHQAMMNWVNPPMDKIIRALDEGDIEKARQLTVQFRADANDYEKATKK